MKRIIIINTYYQLIFAIQMKLTIFENDYVSLVVTDHSKNTDVITEKLSETRCVNEAHYIRTMGSSDTRSKKDRIVDFIEISFLNSNRYENYINSLDNNVYDELIVFNYDMRMYGVYSLLARYNKNLKLSILEEGILAYGMEDLFSNTRSLVGKIRNIQGKPVIEEMFCNFYCFYPFLYKGILNPVKVPVFNSISPIKHILQELFNLNDENVNYPQKYIFFTSVYDFEGGKPVGEYELVCKIADLVGKENLLVKTHPRDMRSIYIDNGFNVDKNSSIPWEAIQLSGDFSDKVFVTVNSGSVLSGNTMSEKPVRTYYMYKLCNISENEPCKKIVQDIENLLQNEEMKKILKTVHIAEKLEDIL